MAQFAYVNFAIGKLYKGSCTVTAEHVWHESGESCMQEHGAQRSLYCANGSNYYVYCFSHSDQLSDAFWMRPVDFWNHLPFPRISICAESNTSDSMNYIAGPGKEWIEGMHIFQSWVKKMLNCAWMIGCDRCQWCCQNVQCAKSSRTNHPTTHDLHFTRIYFYGIGGWFIFICKVLF